MHMDKQRFIDPFPINNSDIQYPCLDVCLPDGIFGTYFMGEFLVSLLRRLSDHLGLGHGLRPPHNLPLVSTTSPTFDMSNLQILQGKMNCFIDCQA